MRNAVAERESHGFGDIGFGALCNFFRTDTTLVSRSVEWMPSLLAARYFESMELHAGIGGAFAGGETALTYSLAAAHALGPVSAVLELSGFGGSERTRFLTPGVVGSVSAWRSASVYPTGSTVRATGASWVTVS